MGEKAPAKEKKKKKKEEKASASHEKSTMKLEKVAAFTPSALNNQIVKMRKIIHSARAVLAMKLVRSMKGIEKKLEKKEDQKLRRKVSRFEEEVAALKKLRKDDVSRFALVNQKTLAQLDIKGKTTALERALFKLATQKKVVDEVANFRLLHPGSETGCAFMLQRLGLQYQAARNEKRAEKLKKELLKEAEDKTVDGKNEEKSSPFKIANVPSDECQNLEEVLLCRSERLDVHGSNALKKVLRKTLAEASKKEKQLHQKVKLKKNAPPIAVPVEVKAKTSLSIVNSNPQAVVKQLRLDEDSEEEDDDDIPMLIEPETDDDHDVPTTSFFLRPGRDTESDGEETQKSEEKPVKKVEGGSKNRQERRAEKLDRQPPKKSRGSDSVGSAKEEKLHPSWIAKQKQREAMSAKPQGKKIVFD